VLKQKKKRNKEETIEVAAKFVAAHALGDVARQIDLGHSGRESDL